MAALYWQMASQPSFGADAALVHQADVVADGGAGALEARPGVGAALMHRGGEDGIEGRLGMALPAAARRPRRE